MSDRKASGERRNDLVDLMLDAMTGNEEENAEPEDQFEKDAVMKAGNKKIKVTSWLIGMIRSRGIIPTSIVLVHK